MSKNHPNLGDYDFQNPGYMIVCSGYQSLVGKENVCVEEEYWASNLKDIHDDKSLTIINLDIPQRSEGQNVLTGLLGNTISDFHQNQYAWHFVLRAVT